MKKAERKIRDCFFILHPLVFLASWREKKQPPRPSGTPPYEIMQGGELKQPIRDFRVFRVFLGSLGDSAC
jgi:hypothetical protein